METTTYPNQRSFPPVGYRFHPTDAELVAHFLNEKILAPDRQDMPIVQVRVCDFDPWDLADQSKIKSTDKVWYFFCPRDFKYSGSRRANRSTNAGYWKPTGKPRKVKAVGTKNIIGTKRSLVFYDKRPPKPVRTKWVMHEYESHLVQGNFVACKLKDKRDEKVKRKKVDCASASALSSPTEKMVTPCSSSGENEYHDNNGEESCEVVIDFEEPNQNEVTGRESEEFCPMASNLEGQNSIYQDCKFNGPKTSIFKSQNLDEKIDILVSEEGEWSPFAAMPDCGNQSPHEKNVLSTLIVADFGINVARAQTSILDVQGPPTFFDDIKILLDLEGSPNSALF